MADSPFIIIAIDGYTTLTRRDCDDMLAVYQQGGADALAELMKDYVDMATPSDRGFWVDVANVLKQMTPYLSLGGAILGVVSGVAALTK